MKWATRNRDTRSASLAVYIESIFGGPTSMPTHSCMGEALWLCVPVFRPVCLFSRPCKFTKNLVTVKPCCGQKTS